MNAPYRNRIAEHEDVAPADLIPYPRNPRRHPEAQREALRGSLTERGWVRSILANKRTRHVLDGHARVEEALAVALPTVPVEWIDVDESEEPYIVTLLDAMVERGEYVPEILAELIAGIETGDSAVARILADLRDAHPVNVEPVAPEEFAEYGEDLDTAHKCPRCGYEWSGGK